MGTLDNIYVLNYLVNKRIERKGGKLVAMFVDLKAAFDSMDSGMLLEEMRRRAVREGLIERVRKVLRETRNRIRVGKEVGEKFWTAKGSKTRMSTQPVAVQYTVGGYERRAWEGEMGRNKIWEGKDNNTGICGRCDDNSRGGRGDEERDEKIRGIFREEEGRILNAGKTKIMRF